MQYNESNYDIAYRIMRKSVIKALRSGVSKLPDVIDAYFDVYGVSEQRKNDISRRCVDILMNVNRTVADVTGCGTCKDKITPERLGEAVIVQCNDCGRMYAVLKD